MRFRWYLPHRLAPNRAERARLRGRGSTYLYTSLMTATLSLGADKLARQLGRHASEALAEDT